MPHIPKNKIVFTKAQHEFLFSNWQHKTNKELADALGLKLTRVRMELYKLGLKRMELQYWTPEQVTFLKDNYKALGDTELAEIFNVKWHKPKGWTKKHIEKKRRYLKLKRTAFQKSKIRERNRLMGRWKNVSTWETRGIAPEGEKRVWYYQDNRPFVVVKTKNGFVHYNRWLWEQHNGPIPKGMVVRNMTSDRINYTINDLRLITMAENSALNSNNRLPKELKQVLNLTNKLQRLINTKNKNNDNRN